MTEMTAEEYQNLLKILEYVDVDDLPVDIDGREQGQGWWLEHLVRMKLIELGFEVSQTRQRVFGGEDKKGFEIDAAATHKGDRLIAQTKDWTWDRDNNAKTDTEPKVDVTTIFRLSFLSFVTSAYPVLVTTADLGQQAKQACELGNIAVYSVTEFLDLENTTIGLIWREKISDDSFNAPCDLFSELWGDKYRDEQGIRYDI